MRTISNLVKQQPDFHVLADCQLGFFNFQKYALFKDMEKHQELYLSHPVTQSILDPNAFNLKQPPSKTFEPFGENSLDSIFPPENAHHVLDADSSQLDAIYQVKQGQHLIIEGPPGTGKSQTIANLIANALGEGKRILFVSEKQAALQVVYDRLEKLGLATQCLELHSTKATRKSVMSELQQAFDRQIKNEANQLDLIKRKLPEVRAQLSQYAYKLHKTHSPLELKLFDAIGRFNVLAALSRPIVRLPEIESVSQLNMEQALKLLECLQANVTLVGKPSQHPWTLVEKNSFSSFDKDELKSKLAHLIDKVEVIKATLGEASTQLGVKTPQHLGEIATFCEVIKTLLESPSSESAILTNEHWNQIPGSVHNLIQTGKQFESLRTALKLSFTDEWLNQADSIYDDWQKLLQSHEQSSFLRYLKPSYYKDLKRFREFLHADCQKQDLERFIKAVRKTIDYAEYRQEIIQQNANATALFGFHWNATETDWQALEKFTRWITQFRQFAMQEYFEAKAFEVASQGKLSNTEWEPRLKSLIHVSQELHDELGELAKSLQLKPQETISSMATPLTAMVEQLQIWQESFSLLDNWTEYLDAKAACLAVPILKTYLLESAIEESSPNVIVKTFEALFYHQWIDKVITKDEELRKFSTVTQQDVQKQFRQLDTEVTASTRADLLLTLQGFKNKAFVQADERTRTYLQTQIRKPRQGDSIRTMFKKASELILYLKPCLMMSPLSVAEFIDPTRVQFDLVVFDEASQVRPAEALAAMIRAKQSVVVGDSKQLPPTNFFGKKFEPKDSQPMPDEQEALIDNEIEESILDQCYKAGFKSKMLKWHYRSKHESLIAFSNEKFYQDLYTFPSAENELYGLKFHHVADGVYEGEGKNTIEAMAIVDEICRHAQHHPHLSLGVATFGMKQRALIMDFIEERKGRDHALTRFLESHPHERFFVKNLENVQGDERDVMMVSVTYGRAANGTLKMLFGPVNGEQGGRRLNVIATRSRYSMKVFASFRADELDPTRLNNLGARYFREFLYYAENKRFSYQGPVETLTSFDSPFEESVYAALSEQGYRCVTQVGQSGYRIDLGILDDSVEGLFIAGIECDGAQYHSSQCARDRDRLRQAVLESLGWTIIRVWSTAWFKNPEAELQRIIAEIEQAKINTHAKRNQKIQQELDIKNMEIEDQDPLIDLDFMSIELPVYVRYIPQAFGQAQQMELDKTFLKVLVAILEVESPIHIDELTRLTIAHWGLARISDRTRDLVRQGLSSLSEMGEPIQLKDVFAYHTAMTIKARNRQLLTPFPKFDLICDEEIEATVRLLLTTEKILPEPQLAQKAAKLLGYERTTTAIKERILSVVRVMLAQSVLAHASYGIQL